MYIYIYNYKWNIVIILFYLLPIIHKFLFETPQSLIQDYSFVYLKKKLQQNHSSSTDWTLNTADEIKLSAEWEVLMWEELSSQGHAHCQTDRLDRRDSSPEGIWLTWEL